MNEKLFHSPTKHLARLLTLTPTLDLRPDQTSISIMTPDPRSDHDLNLRHVLDPDSRLNLDTWPRSKTHSDPGPDTQWLWFWNSTSISKSRLDPDPYFDPISVTWFEILTSNSNSRSISDSIRNSRVGTRIEVKIWVSNWELGVESTISIENRYLRLKGSHLGKINWFGKHFSKYLSQSNWKIFSFPPNTLVIFNVLFYLYI